MDFVSPGRSVTRSLKSFGPRTVTTTVTSFGFVGLMTPSSSLHLSLTSISFSGRGVLVVLVVFFVVLVVFLVVLVVFVVVLVVLVVGVVVVGVVVVGVGVGIASGQSPWTR